MHEGNPLLPGDPSLQVGRENAARYKFNETHDIEVRSDLAPLQYLSLYIRFFANDLP
jgi:hypothetical protein